MKLVKFLLPALVLSFLLYSCDEEYSEITGDQFRGTFVWKYYEEPNDTIRIDNYVDTFYIEIKEHAILSYRYNMRDSSLSYSYALSVDDDSDVYAVNLKAADTVALAKYPYWGTYRFESDTLYIEKFPLKGNSLPDKAKKPLIRNAYVRPKY